MELTRLNKYLADCGVCSRREADKLIEAGKVCVNGTVAGMGTKVSEKDWVTVNGKMLDGKQKTAVLAFYKPVGVTCTEKDKHAEAIINDYIKYPVRLTYAGRLDKESEGLLILTNDGKLIDSMMRSANYHEKEYLVRVNKEIKDDFLKQMAEGIYLEDLKTTTRPCEVEKVSKFIFRIVLTQGLNRQIRRMCKALGYDVIGLKRIRVMNIHIGKLVPGNYRKITGEELDTLYKMTGM